MKNGDGDVQDFRVAMTEDDALADHLKETGVEDAGDFTVDDMTSIAGEMHDEEGKPVPVDLSKRGFVGFGPDA